VIHVAPCSCELHVRIRELEAELELTKATSDQFMHDALDQKAHAEKAEAAARTEAGAAKIHFEARQRLKARVAELERELESKAWNMLEPSPEARESKGD
jgi:F0F1-type ATP synthase membrane subunit b/b'